MDAHRWHGDALQEGERGKVKGVFEKEHARNRRLEAGEEDRLLAAASPHLKALIGAAISTGMRRGEILSLQWRPIEGQSIEVRKRKKVVVWEPGACIFLPHEKTKTKTDRRVAISTRLRAFLEMRRFDPSGEPHGPEAYVFGTDIGTWVKGFKRAWGTAVLRAHGYTPEFSVTANLTREGRAAFKKINLKFQDLRREAGSQWLEGGVPLNQIQAWLGHTTVGQTSTYISATETGSAENMRWFEARSKDLVSSSGKPGRGGPRTAGPGGEKGPKSRGRLSEAVN